MFVGTDKFTKALREALHEKRYRIVRKITEDSCEITNGKHSFILNTTTARKDFRRTGDPDIIADLIKQCECDFITKSRMVSFTNGQVFLRLILMKEENLTFDYIVGDFAGNLKKVIGFTVDDSEVIPLDKSYLFRWDVPKEVLFSVADRNMCKLMERAYIEQSVIGDSIKVAEIKFPCDELRAAMMLCSDFRHRIGDLLGDKFLLVAPSYDGIIAMEYIDMGLLEKLGRMIIKEYMTSPKPLMTEVLEFGPEKTLLIGKFRETLTK